MRAAFKKFTGKPRIVNNLSFPYDIDGSSINANSVAGSQRNTSIRHVAEVLLRFGRGTLMFEFDAVSAYKIPILAPDDWCLQGEVVDDTASWSCVPDFGAKQSGFCWEPHGRTAEFIIRHYARP